MSNDNIKARVEEALEGGAMCGGYSSLINDLYTALQEAEAAAVRLVGLNDKYHDNEKALIDKLQLSQEQNKVAVEVAKAAEPYIHHFGTCPANEEFRECTCGADAVIAKIEAMGET